MREEAYEMILDAPSEGVSLADGRESDGRSAVVQGVAPLEDGQTGGGRGICKCPAG